MARDGSMVSRIPGSELKLRFLLTADRWLVTAGILAVVFLALLALVWLDPTPLESAIASSDPVETLFQAMVTAIVTGVTLVVSINSLVISQELGAVGDQRNRMEGSLSFRDDVADFLGESASPAEPATFLRALLLRTSERAREVERSAASLNDEVVRGRLREYARDLVQDAEAVAADLKESEFGTFDVLSATLDFNYSLKLRDGKAIRRETGDALGEATTDALDDVVTALAYFGPTREHVKTLYFQWELVNLSRAILYAAVPALIVSIGAILTLDNPGTIGGSTLGMANVSWVVVGAATVALAPFAILLAYILRIATIAKRTLAIGPFVLRTIDQNDRGD